MFVRIIPPFKYNNSTRADNNSHTEEVKQIKVNRSHLGSPIYESTRIFSQQRLD